jgi:hypothetical protein
MYRIRTYQKSTARGNGSVSRKTGSITYSSCRRQHRSGYIDKIYIYDEELEKQLPLENLGLGVSEVIFVLCCSS